MMLNLCASLVLAYIVFIASVEETDNEVRTNYQEKKNKFNL